MSFDYLYDFSYDFTNKLKKRTLENSNIDSYNCGGAALMTYDAYIPYRDRENHIDGVQEMYDDGFTISEIEEIVLNWDIEQMLEEFQGRLYVVDKDYKLRPGERLIAYRIFITADEHLNIVEFDSDYHFKFRDYGQKKWFEKCGFTGKIHSCALNDWNNGIWTYDSDIVYLMLRI